MRIIITYSRLVFILKTHNRLTTNILSRIRIAWPLRYSEMPWHRERSVTDAERGARAAASCVRSRVSTGVRLFDRRGLQPRVQRTSRDEPSEATDVVS